MAEIRVIYHSRTGNTQKVADAIAQECGVEAIDVTVPHVLGKTDLLFVGMGIYANHPDSSLMDYLDQLPVNSIKGAALFSTSATGKDHMELAVNLLTHKGITVYPRRLHLKGSWLFLSKGHPDASELSQARRYAEEVMAAFNG